MKRREIKILNCSHVYRVVEVDANGLEADLHLYRVRRRVKNVLGQWTMQTGTFGSLAEAKTHAKRAPEKAVRARETMESTFAQAFTRFLKYKEFEQKVSPGTIQGYRIRSAHLEFFNPILMRLVTPKIVDAWIDLLLDPEYQKGQNTSRVNYSHEYALLAAFTNYYRNFEDETFVVPLLKRHRSRTHGRSRHTSDKIRFMNADEEARLLTGSYFKSETVRDLMLLQLHTGLRIGEAAALEFKNVDFKRREVKVAQHLFWDLKDHRHIEVIPGTKAGPTRIVPLTDECIEMLNRRKTEGNSAVVFNGESATWLAYRWIQHRYGASFKQANIELTGTHVLRHTFAVRFLDRTKDIHALQVVLGHADLKMTQVYAKYTNESVRRSFLLFQGGKTGAKHEVVSRLVSPALL